MREAVIVDAIRSPIGRGKPIKGDLSGVHPVILLSKLLDSLVQRNGLQYEDVEQVIAGCVTQAGEQSNNLARNAWLWLGKNWKTGATTVDSQCGSAQQANHMISAMIQGGSLDIGIACGVESMSRVGLGMNVMSGPGYFHPDGWPWDQTRDQFTSVERMVKNRGLKREDIDKFAFESQTKAAAAWKAGHFDREVLPIEAPILGEDGQPTGETRMVTTDQGIRPTTLEGLAALKPLQEGGTTTAGNSSQISDGAAAILWMSKERAQALGLKPRARIISDVLVGTDPYFLLDGPVDATERILKKSKMSMKDFDLIEINEAFATVVLSWASVYNPDMSKVNVNGGAIALGHPVGSTGTRLIVTALHELERRNLKTAFITMCCGAAVGTGTIIERL